MAQSPAHRFGQIIGEVLEAAVLPVLLRFAIKHQLYLDQQGSRLCRTGKKCTWLDGNGNKHDLDFVLERGGTSNEVGTPVAFIETAWRRYTKHSRNKAQEIQGAIEPLVETFRNSAPFKGAILAGVFTEGALAQLRSLGFKIVYFPYDKVVLVFKRFGIDANFDEDTPDALFQSKVASFERLTSVQKRQLASALVKSRRSEMNGFLAALAISVSRQIDRITIIALHGIKHESKSVDDAIRFVEGYVDDGVSKPIDRYEIDVRYNNDDLIRGHFRDKDSAIAFLQSYRLTTPKIV